MKKSTEAILVIYVRLFVLCMILIEAATLMGYTPFGPEGLTWYWVIYVSFYYFICYELPLFLLRHSPYRHFFVPIGCFIAVNIFFDSIGCLFNLFIVAQYYDDFMHLTLFPWALTAISLGFSAIYCKENQLVTVPKLILILSFNITMTITVIHEIVELGIDWLTSSNAGTAAIDINDTNRDLLCNLIGSITFLSLFWLFFKKTWINALNRP